MRRITILYVGLALGWLTACTESEPAETPAYTVGAEDNPIRLQAGIGTIPSTASTRTDLEGHTALKEGTAITLRVDGTWTGHSPDDIKKLTKAKAGTVSGSVNALTDFSPMLYWDDYGTADPANSTNRTTGLTIYGVAVDGEDSPVTIDAADATEPTESNWTSKEWEVVTTPAESDPVKDVLKKDLLVGKLQLPFDDRNNEAKNYLDLKHVLSKITIQLTANKGFDKFPELPKVTLSSNVGSETSEVYAITKGSVDLTTGEVTPSTAEADKKIITAAVAWSGEDPNLQEEATATALLFPGSEFAESDDAVVAKVVVYKNIYYIRAKELREALALPANNHKNGSNIDYSTRSGFNYVISVKVNKSEILVSASIKDWDVIESAEVQPKVNVDVETGSSTGSTMIGNQFDLYYSESTTEKFDAVKLHRVVEKVDDNWNIQGEVIYWPTHETHYFFRGVTALKSESTSESVENTNWNFNSGNPYVTVSNGKFDQYTHPSNLLMGKPVTTGYCSSTDHDPVDMETGGICARTTPITLTFRYMMSQVEVVLSTEESSTKKVHLDKYTKVEITNCFKDGQIYLGSMKAVVTGSSENYILDSGSTDKKRLSVIVPQGLYTDEGQTTSLQFKITVYKDKTYGVDDPTDADIDDIYYANIADIKIEGNTISQWESGYHYVYSLKVLKSGIEAIANLTDWVTVEGGSDVWL